MHFVVRLQKKANKLHKKGYVLIPKIMWAINRVFFSCDIPASVEIGNGTGFFHNGLGCVIHGAARIGDECKIYQNVTMGGNGKEKCLNGVPIIGDNVSIGAGAVLLGPIVIGNNAVIGANSVVINNVEENTTVAGIPARKIDRK
ncbi:serine O-acetyltransferase [Vibrio splendidus]|uniref:serine O-acetyltransferase n=1 Tax=Vibrio splendidus TaxID=29497 RepID=UPI000C81A96A|nr:DapH/DapD/GlmU-related protein [Vibrio splendidus]PMK14702.1 hypothetical protein BCU08_22345 [Vibrio splendidus]